MPTDQQETDEPLEFVIDPDEERAAREADAELEKAMNAFWRAYQCGTRDLWRCVQAAIRAGRRVNEQA